MRLTLFFIIIIGVSFSNTTAQSNKSFILPDDGQNITPWKGVSKSSQDDISFQFAIVSDRTGGMQPGVFKKAVEKLNLLQPEFVISVGDLVEGYTTNKNLAIDEWNEFDGMISQLTMPFFYLPGNHDYTNQVMKNVWQERLGQSYYYFLYKNVLFLCLNTEDENFDGLSQEQVAYFKNVLKSHKETIWTFVFMHAPLWDYGNMRGYEQIEEVLQNRNYTLFSGHHHNYVKKEKAGKNHFVLATTGGGSSLRGAEFGEFHHLVWVTVNADGPVIANLAVDGIYDENIVIEKDYPQVEALRHGNWLQVKPVVAEQDNINELQIELIINNPADSPIKISGELAGQQGLIFEPQSIEVTIPAETEKTFNVIMKSVADTIQISTLDPVTFTLDGSYLDSRGQTLKLPAIKTLLMDWKHKCLRQNTNVTIDGLLNEWEDADWIAVKHPQDFEEGWDWHGVEDGHFKIATGYDDKFLYIAVDAFDDIIHPGKEKRTDPQDRLTIFLMPESNPEFQTSIEISPLASGNCDVHLKDSRDVPGIQADCRLSDHKISAEFAIPRSSLTLTGKTFRLNVAFEDHDNPDNTKPSILYWRPKWGSSKSYYGSGIFKLQ